MRKRAFLLTLAVLTPALAAGQKSLPDPRGAGVEPGKRLALLVERVRLEQSQMRTLEAEFVQLKESAFLLEPSEAQGVFSYQAPDRVRWEYQTPDPISLLVAGDEMTTWYHDLGQAERIHVGRQTQRVLDYLGAGSSMDSLLEYFDARLAHSSDTSLPFRLELLPRFERVARRLREMTIWIDGERFLPIRLRYVEADGDVTDYRFSNLRVNGEFPDDRFQLDLPQEVDLKVVDLEQGALAR